MDSMMASHAERRGAPIALGCCSNEATCWFFSWLISPGRMYIHVGERQSITESAYPGSFAR